MKNIGLIANLDRDIGGKYLTELAGWLSGAGFRPIVTEQMAQFVHTPCHVACEDELFADSDFCVVLGGDGTILRASKPASKYGVPLLGINLGTLGYLTDVESSGGIESLTKVLEGNYVTERRMMLTADILEADLSVADSGLLALNDVCILRGAEPKIKSFSMSINGQFLNNYKSDGVIIATPTGSTAYNLAAGGPVLKPDIEAIAITPVCPHNMHSRPLVVSGEDVLGVGMGEGFSQEVILTLDGQDHINLESGQRVRVKKSDNYTTLIKTNDMGFYDILRMKLH